MVEQNYNDIVYEARIKLEFYAALEVLKLKGYVDADESYNKEDATEGKKENRSAVVKHMIQVGLLDILKNMDGYNPDCSLQLATRLGMFRSSERSSVYQIKSITHGILSGESGRATREANLMQDCLTKM